jgi:heme-degrading monooxygenase HmoA
MMVIVFRNRLKPAIEEEYGAHASAVFELAQRMPGFVASKDFAADDGERLTVIEFEGPAELAAWRNQPQHREAQEDGRRRYYTQYSLQVCELARESRWVDAGDQNASPSSGASLTAQSALEPFEGGCFCGSVRYRATGRPYDTSICHCSICRRTSGAPMVGWTTFETSELSWLKGQPRRFSSSQKAERSFCSECGTALTFVLAQHPERTDVTLASLDHPERLTPLDHIHTSSRIPWVRLADGLPAFPEHRGDETP